MPPSAEEQDGGVVSHVEGEDHPFHNNINSKGGMYRLTLSLNLFTLWYNHIRCQGIRVRP